MSAFAALKTQELDSVEEFSASESVPMSRFSDELFSAVKNGNTVKVRELLDIDDTETQTDTPGMAALMEAVQEHKEEKVVEELMRISRMSGQQDLTMAALMLAAAGGNPEVARELLNKIDGEELVNAGTELALETARERGDFATVALIEQRVRSMEFNEKARHEQEEQHVGSVYENICHFISSLCGGKDKEKFKDHEKQSRFINDDAPRPDQDFFTAEKAGLTEEEQKGFATKVMASLKGLLHLIPRA